MKCENVWFCREKNDGFVSFCSSFYFQRSFAANQMNLCKVRPPRAKITATVIWKHHQPNFATSSFEAVLSKSKAAASTGLLAVDKTQAVRGTK